MKKFILATTAAAATALLSSAALATTITGTFNVTGYYTTQTTGAVQTFADAGNTLISPKNLAITFTGNSFLGYNSANPAGTYVPYNPGGNTFGNFVFSFSNWSLSPGFRVFSDTALSSSLNSLSNPTSGTTTIFDIQFTLPQTHSILAGTFTHDDGFSVYENGTALYTSQAAPTSAQTSAYLSLLGGNTYDIYYVETNGAPGQLTFNGTETVPEPSTLFVMGAALLGLGVASRRKGRA